MPFYICRCVRYCRDRGNAYAGLQYSSQGWVQQSFQNGVNEYPNNELILVHFMWSYDNFQMLSKFYPSFQIYQDSGLMMNP